MIEKSFAEFMQTNFTAVDELSRRFIEYRIAVAERYADELRAKIKATEPAGYSFEVVDVEKICAAMSD